MSLVHVVESTTPYGGLSGGKASRLESLVVVKCSCFIHVFLHIPVVRFQRRAVF